MIPFLSFLVIGIANIYLEIGSPHSGYEAKIEMKLGFQSGGRDPRGSIFAYFSRMRW